ncbi:hypothetical protein [Flavobacterium sp.]|uniref:hypothetical protein n=1 Tax=Flavobacterium sp. TaxID=239 RepID=UPI0035284ECC
MIDQYRVENKMKQFDLNNDGFFNSNEMNTELKSLQMEYISDAGGNLFILYGFPVCLILSIIITIIHKAINNK